MGVAAQQVEPRQKFATAVRRDAGIGYSFQPAIVASSVTPHGLRHCPKRKDADPTEDAGYRTSLFPNHIMGDDHREHVSVRRHQVLRLLCRSESVTNLAE